ncbi:PDZ domain-containing protein [Chenggangzhangella methanolivorans]|uniref:PDZ domain-containing protein n=1 Tax=Chenggangzhangella methanolivorans TaxID=1437009 RepID=UPI0028F3EAF3|nr:PDZ domain-containing protein [Chenggangzhangella methanolivorans]
MQNVTKDIADGLGLNHPGGALIANVAKGSPAAKAGAESGDLITAVDGRPVDDVENFSFRFATRPVGGHATVTIQRQGKARDLKVELAAAPENPPREQRTIGGETPFTGATVVNLSPALAEEMSLGSGLTGVAVAEVASGSIAERLGFQKGDVVRQVKQRQDRQHPRSRARRGLGAERLLEGHDRARRAAGDERVLTRLCARHPRRSRVSTTSARAAIYDQVVDARGKLGHDGRGGRPA